MTKLYQKDKLTFALALIGAYVIFASVADVISAAVGVEKIATAPYLAIMSATVYIWLSKNKLMGEYGLSRVQGDACTFMYFIPLLILISANLWNGITLNMPIPDTVLYIVSMIFVGFIEEIIFRGFLFKALCELGISRAFVISSVTFGVGHIVNLFGGAELLPTVLQIISAIAIGFLFTLIFYKTQSLIPCIITHGAFNSLSAIGVEPSDTGRILMCAAICSVSVLYSFYIVRKAK